MLTPNNDADNIIKVLNGQLGAVNFGAVDLLKNAQIDSNALIAQSKLDPATLHRSAVYVQSITSNALTSNQVIYRGWGYTGNFGAPTGTITITLPNSGFDDAAYEVFVTYLGEKATNPTSRIDVTSHRVGSTAAEDPTLPRSATQFRATFTTGAGGGNFTIVAFSWMAIGTKA